MSTTASLDSTSITIDPGSEAVVPIQIRNNGEIVEGYRLSVVGVPASWATVEPAELSLYPGTATTATVTFRPPRTARTAAGEQGFGVVVSPSQSPDQSVVPEGVVEVLPFLETTAELIPRTSQGRRGKHQVAIDNRGNVPVNVVVDANSDGDRLKFKVNPVGLVVQPGEAQFATIKAKARKPIWRGQPVTHPIIVDISPKDSTPVALDGGYVQTPVLPKWLGWLLLGLIALIALLLALWFLLLKPTIESSAKEAAEEEVVKAEKAAEEAKEAAEGAGQNAAAAGDAAGDAQKAKKTAEDLVGEPRPPRVLISDASRRMTVTTTGTEASDPFEIPEDGSFKLTDVLFSNPQGDFGMLRLRVDGEVQYAVALENFRDLDFHFVTPLIATEEIDIQVVCRTPGQPPDAPVTTSCTAAALVGGELTVPAPKTP